MDEETWYKLDNAAKIYPAIREENWAPVYRMDAVLKEDVDPVSLQSALLITYKRFPTFSVHIVKGFFWYYFDPNESEPEVMPESDYPARPFSEKDDKGYLFRVLYYKKRISLEVFHSISDGYGATVFLRSLLFNYFMILNGQEPVKDRDKLDKYGILYYKDLPSNDEIEDSFRYYAIKNNKLNFKENIAFKIPGKRIAKNEVKVIHVIADVNKLHELSKEFDSTITVFLISLFIYSIFNARIYNYSEKRPVKISAPINLRKRFNSKTMRNFSSYINVEIFPDKNADKTSFEDICLNVKNQIRKGVDTDELRYKFSSTVNAEKNIFFRIVPLFIKNLVLKSGFSLYGERIITSTLSNIGNIKLPEEMSDLIERFDFVLGAPKNNAMNCAVASFNDKISISFTSIISENSIIKRFVGYLTEHDIDVSVSANY